jgi:diacylglycerol kinase family enzyme
LFVFFGIAGEPLRRYFLNEATCGVIAYSLRFVRPFKIFGAFLGYMLAGAIGVLTYPNVACRVKFDGGDWTAVPHLTVIPLALAPLPPITIPPFGLPPSS